MDGTNAVKIANRTAERLESRLGYRLSEDERKEARSFVELILREFYDRQLSQAVIARAQFEADHGGEEYELSARYMELVAVQLDCTRRLVESLKAMTDHWVYWCDGKYVLLKGGTGRILLLEEQVERLAAKLSELTEQAHTESA